MIIYNPALNRVRRRVIFGEIVASTFILLVLLIQALEAP